MKKIGWLCAYTPEEIILASSLQPVRIGGSGEEPAGLSLKLPANLCPYVRGVLDSVGRSEAETYAGVAVTASCDAMRRLADAWRGSFPATPIHVIDFPRRTGKMP